MSLPPATVIYLLGGTTEANLAALRLRREGYAVTVSVATPLGLSLAAASGGAGSVTDTGRKDAAHLASRAAELRAAAIVDCSHPFADMASLEARRAAAITGLPYLRYCRAPLVVDDDVDAIRAGSWAEAVEILKDRPGRALLTVGVSRLELFVRGGVRFTARILPLPDSLAECVRLGIGPRHLICAQPPFTVEFNRACIRHAKADVIVSKESGKEGGLPEKAEAARLEGVDLLIVDRPADSQAIYELETLVKNLQEVLSS